MDQEQAIHDLLQNYLSAFHSSRFDELYTYFHEPEVEQLYHLFLGLAKGLEPFGENRSLYHNLPGINTIEELESLGPKRFLRALIRYSDESLEASEMETIAESLIVHEIDDIDYFAQVAYSFENVFAKDGSRIESELQMLNTQGKWKILFKPGAKRFFEQQHEKIIQFNDRKQKDHPERNKAKPDEVEKFAIYGFQDFNGRELIHPRFKKAEDFQDGLALVKAFSLWGYIDLTGEFAIKPAFEEAHSFSCKRALVAAFDRKNGKLKYWFIDQTGQAISKQFFDEAYSFCENLAAVKVEEKWGFIKLDGSWHIKAQFDHVYDFEDGISQVSIQKEDGTIQYLSIDLEGNLVDDE